MISGEEERLTGLTDCLQTFTRIWHERKGREPVRHDLLLQRDTNTADIVDRPMEYLGNLVYPIVGGNDTTRNSATGGVLALNQNPAEYDKLRANPGLIPAWCRKLFAGRCRWRICAVPPPVTWNSGAGRSAGDKVVLWYLSGNRDESVIEHADSSSSTAKNPRHHISFGFGYSPLHGATGWREMQLRILWEELSGAGGWKWWVNLSACAPILCAATRPCRCDCTPYRSLSLHKSSQRRRARSVEFPAVGDPELLAEVPAGYGQRHQATPAERFHQADP